MSQYKRVDNLKFKAKKIAAHPNAGEVRLRQDEFNLVCPVGCKFNANSPEHAAALMNLADAVEKFQPPGIPDQTNFGASTPLTFAGAIKFEMMRGNVGTMSPRDITINARTDGPAFQEYWGECYHDMAGFNSPEKPVVLDYNHDGSEAVGLADHISIQDGQLIAKGRLTPFKADDQASELISKGMQKVPYQASITMSPKGLQVEKVSAGKTASVNCRSVSGPCVIFRKWSIQGIAITPYGSDGDTSVQFSAPSACNRSTLDSAVKSFFSKP